MIKNFKDKEAEKIFNDEFSKKLPQSIQGIARRKLYMIDSSTSIEDLRIPPSNHLERLKGKRSREWSIRINKQYRICFKWINGNSEDVFIEDYH